MFHTLTAYVHARTQSLDNNAKCVGTTFVPSDLLFGESTDTDNLVRYLFLTWKKIKIVSILRLTLLVCSFSGMVST